MRKLITTLALAGGILILTGIATPALAADIQGGEPSASTQTPSGTPTGLTPLEPTQTTTSAPDPSQQKSHTDTSTGDTHSGVPSTAPSQPTGSQVAGLKSGHSMASSPTTTSSQTQSGNSGNRGAGHTPVTLCHKPGTPAEHTLTVDDDAVPAHLAHGDYLGECKPSTPTPTPTPTITVTPPTGPPPSGVDSQTSVSYDCTTGMATKTLTETPYTWIRNDNGTYTKVPGTPVVTKTVRTIDPEEYTCPVNTPTNTPTEPTTPGTPQSPTLSPVGQTPSGSATRTTQAEPQNTLATPGADRSTATNPRTALADTGSNLSGTISAAGITLIICGLLALLVAIILKRRNGDGDAD